MIFEIWLYFFLAFWFLIFVDFALMKFKDEFTIDEIWYEFIDQLKHSRALLLFIFCNIFSPFGAILQMTGMIIAHSR